MTEEQRKHLITMLEQGGECKNINCEDCYFSLETCFDFLADNNVLIVKINEILVSEKIKLI